MSSLDLILIGLRVLFAAAGWLIAFIAWRAWRRECDEGRADRRRLIRQKCQALLVGRQACDEADKTLQALSAACKDNARLRVQVADLTFLATSEGWRVDYYFRKWRAAAARLVEQVGR